MAVANTVEVSFRGSKRDQEREEARLVRTRGEESQYLEDVQVLHNLFWHYESRAELPLTLFKAGRGCRLEHEDKRRIIVRRELRLMTEK